MKVLQTHVLVCVSMLFKQRIDQIANNYNEVENYNEGAQYESLEIDWLGRVVLGFPKPLECIDSFLTKFRSLWSSMG